MSFAATLAVTAGSFLEKKDFKNALLSFDQCIEKLGEEKLTPRRVAWIYAHRAETHLNVAQKRSLVMSDIDVNKQMERAREDYEMAIDADPTYAWAYAHLGELCRHQVNRMGISPKVRQEYFELGKKSFKKACELDDQYAWAWSHWGALLGNMRTDYKQSLEYLRRALIIRRNTDAWAFANEVVGHYQENNMARAFNALFSSISIDPNIFTHAIFPAAEILNHRDLNIRDQFLWALRNFIVVKHKAGLKDEQAGPLKGFYEPFAFYFSLVQQVISWLADEVDPDKVLPDKNEWESDAVGLGVDNEATYRLAGVHALIYKALSTRNQGSEADLNELKDRALTLLRKALKGLNPQIPRDKELLDLALRDVAWYELAAEVDALVPEDFKKFLGYGRNKD